MTDTRPRLLIATLLCLASAGFAVPLESTVKYVSATAIYLDAGRVQGIQKGDSAVIRRGDALIARVVVEFVADNSVSCRILEGSGVIRVGDRAVVQITPPPEVKPDTTKALPAPVAPATPPVKKAAKRSRFTGRVGVQALSQNDRSVSNNDFVEPAVVLRGQVNNLFGTQHTLSLRMRSRKTTRVHGPDEDWTHNVYEFALYYDNPRARVHYGLGRVLSNRMSGVGYLDGAVLDYRLNTNWTVGTFGGTQPDLRTYDVKTDQTKGGVFAAYDLGDFSTSRLSGTLALAGNYFNGNISREFMYEQLSYSRSKLFLYQSSELNINRGWRKRVEGSSMDLSSVLLNARYSPLRWLTATLSYDNRTNFRTYETRQDSIFDNALRQGWRLGMNLKFTQQIYAQLEGGLRTTEHQGTETRSGTAGIGGYNLFRSGIQADARVNVFRSRYSNGLQPSLTVSRQVVPSLRASVQYGLNQYTIEQTQTDVNNRWLRLSTDWNLSRHIYGSLYGEVYRGDGLDADRGFAEVGYRF